MDIYIVEKGDTIESIGRKYNIPVIVYSTEGYSFMDYNYFTNRPSVAYRLYYAWLCREYKKVAAYTKCGFFNSTLLRDKYQSEYGYPCKCLMNSSEIEFWHIHRGILNGE